MTMAFFVPLGFMRTVIMLLWQGCLQGEVVMDIGKGDLKEARHPWMKLIVIYIHFAIIFG